MTLDIKLILVNYNAGHTDMTACVFTMCTGQRTTGGKLRGADSSIPDLREIQN